MIALINFLIFIGFYLVTVTLPVHVKNLGAADQTVGWVNGIFTLAGLLTRPFVGAGLDSLGRKGIFLAGMALFALTTLSYGWLPTVGLVLLVRFIQGFGWGAANGASNTIASDNLPKPRLAEGMGFFALTGDLATIFAPALGLSLLLKHPFTAVSCCASASLFLAFLLALGLKYRKISTPAQSKAQSKEQSTAQSKAPSQTKSERRLRLVEPTAIRPALIIFLINITFGAINSFVALYAIDRKIEKSGLFFTVMALTMIFCKPRFGRLADRYGTDVVVMPGMLLVFIAVITLSASTTLVWFLLSALLYGIGFGAIFTSLQSLAVRHAPPECLGAATSTFFTGFETGNGFGSILLGIVATRFGYSRMFLISSLAILLALVLYIATRKRRGRAGAGEDAA